MEGWWAGTLEQNDPYFEKGFWLNSLGAPLKTKNGFGEGAFLFWVFVSLKTGVGSVPVCLPLEQIAAGGSTAWLSVWLAENCAVVRVFVVVWGGPLQCLW